MIDAEGQALHKTSGFMKKIYCGDFVLASLTLEANAQVVYIPQLDPVAMHLQQQLFQQMAFGEMYKNSIAGGGKTRAGGTNSQKPAAKMADSITAYSPAGGRILPERLSVAAGKSATEIRDARQTFDIFGITTKRPHLHDGFPPTICLRIRFFNHQP